MRHLKRGRKLNRTPTHRKAMVRNLTASLFIHGRVVTTPAKAKETRPFAEKLITLGKRGTLQARRRAEKLLHDRRVVKNLFQDIAPRYASRPGGYCRILHLPRTRIGDSAPQVIFELVEEAMPAPSAASGTRSDTATPAQTAAGDSAGTQPATDSPVADAAEAGPADAAEATQPTGQAPAAEATQAAPSSATTTEADEPAGEGGKQEK